MAVYTSLQVGTTFEQATPMLNDNFENVVTEANTLSTLHFGVGSPIFLATLAANQFTFGFNAGVTNTAGLSFPLEVVTGDVYLDGTDAAHRWPDGSALTAGHKKFFIEMRPRASFANLTPPPAGQYATGAYWNLFYNGDTVPHDLYLQYGFVGFPTYNSQFK